MTQTASNYEYYVTSEPESAALRRPTLRATTLRRANHVYIRRRIVVASVFFSVLAALGVGAGNVLANRGGAPASAPVVRQANPEATYVVQPGDTIWSIAEVHHGEANLADFVNDLVELNGGTVVQVGQQLTLP